MPTTDPFTDPSQQETDKDSNLFLDLMAAPFRGVEGAVQGVYNLADFATFDVLPDYDTRFLGKSKTVAGGMVEGVSQFLTGFVPFFGAASKAGGFAKVGGLADKAFSGVKVARAGSLTQKALGGPIRAGIAAGMAADFTVFDGQEARLSNLIQQFPQLQNPVTEFLAARDDDNEAVGRLKNTLEGLGLEFAVGGLIAGLRGLKNGRRIKAETGDPHATNNAVTDIVGDGSGLELESFSKQGDEVSDDILEGTEPTAPKEYNLNEKQGRRDRMEDWIKERYEQHKQKMLKNSGKEPDQMPAGWQDTAMKRVSEDMRLRNDTPDWLDDQELDEVLHPTVDRETGEKLDIDNPEYPRTGTLLDFIEGQELGRIPDMEDVATAPKPTTEFEPPINPKTNKPYGEGSKAYKDARAKFDAGQAEPTAPKATKADAGDEPAIVPISKSKKDAIDDAYKPGGELPPRGRIINYGQLDTTDEFDQMRHTAREYVEKEIPDPGPKDFNQQREEADAYGEFSGVSKQVADNWKDVVINSTDMARKVRMEVQFFKDMSRSIAEKAVGLTKKWKESGSEADLARLKNTLIEAFEFEAYYSALGREQSLGLGARREVKGRKIGLNEVEISNQGMRQRFLDEGVERMEKIMDALDVATDSESAEAIVKKLFDVARATKGGKLAMVQEYWINSVLSGLRTQAVNLLGNSMTTAFSIAEASAGALMSGNLDVFKSVIKASFDGEMITDAWKLSMKSLKEGENILDIDSRAFDDGTSQHSITPEAFGKTKDDPSYNFIKRMGEFVRLPSRGLLAGDEFFKQLNYRRTARIKAAYEGITKHGITDPNKLGEHIHDRIEGIITENGRHYSQESLIREGTAKADEKGLKDAEKADFIQQYVSDNWDAEKSGLAQYAIDEARYLTFTGDLGEGTWERSIQQFVGAHPMFKFALPFVRTPVNILRYAFERTPGVVLLKKERDLLFKNWNSEDPILKAQTRGRVASSIGFTATLLGLTANHRESITGGGPKDHKQKKALEATGWQPYSIKIGDKYFSYQRLDPLGTVLGVAADLAHMSAHTPMDYDESIGEHITSAMIVTLQRNVTNKSYLAGIQLLTDALSDTSGNKAERMMRNLLSGFVPQSAFISQGHAVFGTEEERELSSVRDGLLYKLPGGRYMLDPKRNLMGEAYQIENLPLIGAINPIAYSTDKKDVVFNEMAGLNHAFRQPDSTYGGVIDLLAFTNDSGQTAHDRRLELLQEVRIGGRSMRQALERLIRSRKYQRFDKVSEPGLPSPRISLINSVMRKYRTKALNQAINEFPELQDYYKQVTRAKKQYRQGADHSDILQLLQ